MSSDEESTLKSSYKSLCMRISRLNVKIELENSNMNGTSYTVSPKQVRILKLRLVDFDWNFFYGLIYYSKASPQFKSSLFILFVHFLINRYLKSNKKHVPRVVKISYQELKAFLNEYSGEKKDTVSKKIRFIYGDKKFLFLHTKADRLVETNHITRAW